MQVRFQIALVALLVAIVCSVAGGMLFVLTSGSQRIVGDAAFAFMDEAGDRVADRIGALVDPVEGALRILATRPPLLDSTTPADAGIVPTFIQALELHPDLYGMLAGYADGNFLQVESLAAMPADVRSDQSPPPRARYRVTEIRRDGEHRLLRRWWLDAAGVELAEIDRATDPAYDPRARPWYREATSKEGKRITDLYVFASLRLPGYTVHVPLDGKVEGVLAADLLLGSLDEFLKGLRISPNGRVILFDEYDHAAAGGLSELLQRQRPDAIDDQLRPPPLSVLQYPALEKAITSWRKDGAQHQAVAHDGRTFIASIRSIGGAFAAGTSVIVVAPLDEFFGAIQGLRDRMLLMALGLAVLALPAVVAIGRAVTRQLAALAVETTKIRKLELAPTPRVRSRIVEIDQLAQSIERTKSVVHDFTRFVPRRLVEQLVESGTPFALGGERRELTILFTDAVDFTTLAERADPADLMRNASRYLGALSTAIAAHGGTIDKYIGDAIMAFWNAPASNADHTALACEAVLACRAANRRLNETLAAEGWPAMNTRYALHVGEVIVGNVGSEDRMNYTAIGAAVNLASRLEALNKRYGTDVLVSADVVKRVADRFLFRRIDRVQPKGLSEALTIFSLIGRREATTNQAPAGGPARLELWDRILDAYDRRQWAEAIERIETYLATFADDDVARHYLGRCKRYLAYPPPRDRELVEVYEEK